MDARSNPLPSPSSSTFSLPASFSTFLDSSNFIDFYAVFKLSSTSATSPEVIASACDACVSEIDADASLNDALLLNVRAKLQCLELAALAKKLYDDEDEYDALADLGRIERILGFLPPC